jgi:hypothetical protein
MSATELPTPGDSWAAGDDDDDIRAIAGWRFPDEVVARQAFLIAHLGRRISVHGFPHPGCLLVTSEECERLGMVVYVE